MCRSSVPPAARPPSSASQIEIGAPSRFWLRLFFWCSVHARWLLWLVRPLSVWIAVQTSAKLRPSITANARRILPSELSESGYRAFARRVVGQFFDCAVDIARSGSMSAAQLRSRIESIEGREAYLAHRSQSRGAIILTAHMGSFEIGLAALRDVEPQIHVVFKRDAMDSFEMIRQRTRATLGIHEAPIDEGWDTWMRLRDALQRNEVVVMQGDRAMPGQKAQAVPVRGGHLVLRLGPMKRAHIRGS